MTTVVGLDAGNSEATLTTAGSSKGTAATIPSYIGTGTLGELERIRGGMGADRTLQPGEYTLEIDGRSYFVGNLALEQTDDAGSARGDVSRYWNGHTLRLLLTLAGALLKNESAVRVVTGLPVEVWSKEAVKKVQQSLVGTHRYTWNGRPRALTVEGVMVMMEGAGALATSGTVEDVPQAVIDVGGRTTDLFWAQGMKPIRTACKGHAAGVEKAADLLTGAFERKHGRPLKHRELRNTLRAYAEGSEPAPIYVNGARVELNGQVSTAIRTVGDEIASFVARTWRSGETGGVAADAARVLLIGGGAHYFAPQLQQLIPHLTVPRQPELANAQGYLAVGLQVPEASWARLRGA